MKKECKVKNILVCTAYLVLVLLCILGVYTLVSLTLSKENDNIVQASQGSTYLRNVNPKFLVDFVNDEYVRFETVSSYKNVLEYKTPTIWEKIKYYFGIKQERKGVQISLIEVTYSDDLLQTQDLQIPEYSLSKNFELLSLGREIGSESKDAISKDTVISKNIYKGVDLEYQILTGKGLKEEIVLNELPEYIDSCEQKDCVLPVNRFLFKLELDEGLTIQRNLNSSNEYPNGITYITDKQGNYFAHFLPEYAVDALGTKTSNVYANILRTDSNEYTYEVILDSKWLLNEERVFPIRIDPSIVHNTQEVFSQGVFDRTNMDSTLLLTLNSEDYKSGTYTSSILDLDGNSTVEALTWQGYGQATGNGEVPFSELGLLLEENFNDLVSNKAKWGSGSLQLETMQDSKVFTLPSSQSTSFTVEFYSYKRYVSNQQYIFKSNLGNLLIKDSEYIFEDLEGLQYPTQIPLDYNSWQNISLVFNTQALSLSIYIDEMEYLSPVAYLDQTSLQTVEYFGTGYIDTLRVYERSLAKNEILSNSQYTDISLQYMASTDGINWNSWVNRDDYLPQVEKTDTDLNISTQEVNFSDYSLLSFDFLSASEQEITLGQSIFENGGIDEQTVSLDAQQGDLDSNQEVGYLDLVFSPNANQNSCILALEPLKIYIQDSGEVVATIQGEEFVLSDMYILEKDNIFSLSLSDLGTQIYLNGNIFETTNLFSLSPSQYSIGQGCFENEEIFNGEINNVRISSKTRESSEIFKYHDILQRRYLLKPSFVASLQRSGEILSTQDTTFYITETPSGSSLLISNLDIGDTVVISQAESMVQGKVRTLDKDTGLVTVDSWLEGGTIPSEGFTTDAVVLKWQTEYIPTDIFLIKGQGVNHVNMFGDIPNIQNVTFLNPFTYHDIPSFEQQNIVALKYRFIYTTSKYGLTPYLSSVNISLSSQGPTMDKVMRHGKWFDEGVAQPYWWAQ